MYPEFIIMYVGLAIVLIVSIVNLVFTIRLSKKMKINNAMGNRSHVGGVVFCKKCATEFDSNTKVCPNCGTIR